MVLKEDKSYEQREEKKQEEKKEEKKDEKAIALSFEERGGATGADQYVKDAEKKPIDYVNPVSYTHLRLTSKYYDGHETNI